MNEKIICPDCKQEARLLNLMISRQFRIAGMFMCKHCEKGFIADMKKVEWKVRERES